MKKTVSKICSRGISMLPLISPDALVQIDFSVRKYYIGDIVVFYHNQQFLIHRIIAKSAHNTFLIKGDNNCTTDGFFQSKNILGKVVSVNNSGHFVNISGSPHKEFKYLFILFSWIKLLTTKLFS